jgi:hypothetical protein
MSRSIFVYCPHKHLYIRVDIKDTIILTSTRGISAKMFIAHITTETI